MIEKDKNYRHAIDKNGNLIHVSAVTEESRYEGYHCVCCNGELVPVLGRKNAHHFRHKTDACSYESYIHKVWKQYIFDYWNEVDHFNVSFNVEQLCDKAPSCMLIKGRNTFECNSKFIIKTIDLKEKYDVCEVERCYGEFRADLMLSNSTNPDIVPTFIEICFKHPCDEQKRKSGIPIIELSVNDDNLHLPQPLKEKPSLFYEIGSNQVGDFGVTLYGFERKTTIQREVRRFYVYQDEYGINHGKVDDCITSCRDIDAHKPDDMMEIFVLEKKVRSINDYFVYGAMKANELGIKIRHCRLCKFWGNRGQSCQPKMRLNEDESLIVNINDLSDLELDKTNYTYICPYYREWYFRNSLSKDSIPYVVWINNTYVRKTAKKPTNVNMNLKISRLREIVLKQ